MPKVTLKAIISSLFLKGNSGQSTHLSHIFHAWQNHRAYIIVKQMYRPGPSIETREKAEQLRERGDQLYPASRGQVGPGQPPRAFLPCSPQQAMGIIP